jgi:hypothetical protein
MKKVGCTIKRIDDPLILIAILRTAFFGQETVPRICLMQDTDDLPLCLLVNLGYEVVSILGVNRQSVDPIETADYYIARTASCADCDG